MPLSARAQSYLATLPRHPAVPVARVADALRRAGAPVVPAWLDFHDRYAGIEDPLGRDLAILGIVHEETHWLSANDANVEQENDGSWWVLCAEVHGSYAYRLEEDGSFHSYGAGGPCASFDVRIEQDAVLWSAFRDGRSWTSCFDFTRRPRAAGLDALRAAVRAEIVPEASDRFATVWRGDDATWLEGRPGGEASERFHLAVAEVARARITATLRGG
jgi:hypothetical protein